MNLEYLDSLICWSWTIKLLFLSKLCYITYGLKDPDGERNHRAKKTQISDNIGKSICKRLWRNLALNIRTTWNFWIIQLNFNTNNGNAYAKYEKRETKSKLSIRLLPSHSFSGSGWELPASQMWLWSCCEMLITECGISLIPLPC